MSQSQAPPIQAEQKHIVTNACGCPYKLQVDNRWHYRVLKPGVELVIACKVESVEGTPEGTPADWHVLFSILDNRVLLGVFLECDLKEHCAFLEYVKNPFK